MAVLGVVIGVAWSCGSSSRFTCLDDGVCTLAGVQGVCVEDGHCAYPDESCGSGLAYPAGSTPELAGTCVPSGGGTAATEGDDDATSKGDDDDDIDPDDDDDDAATDDTTTDDDDDETDGTETATAGSTGSGGATTGGPCPDMVGDSEFDSTNYGACEGGGNSTLTDLDDIDWYQFYGPDGDCPSGEYQVSATADIVLSVCVIADCGANEPGIECGGDSSLTVLDGFDACCGTPPVNAYLACGVDGAFDPHVVIVSDRAPIDCADYTWSLAIIPDSAQ